MSNYTTQKHPTFSTGQHLPPVSRLKPDYKIYISSYSATKHTAPRSKCRQDFI